jgi:hypothetical protein
LRTCGTEQGQATFNRLIQAIMGYPCPYSIVEISPLSGYTQKLPIAVLSMSLNEYSSGKFRIPTGTEEGNASLLIRTILLIKFMAAVLHSRASMRK